MKRLTTLHTQTLALVRPRHSPWQSWRKRVQYKRCRGSSVGKEPNKNSEKTARPAKCRFNLTNLIIIFVFVKGTHSCWMLDGSISLIGLQQISHYKIRGVIPGPEQKLEVLINGAASLTRRHFGCLTTNIWVVHGWCAHSGLYYFTHYTLLYSFCLYIPALTCTM